MIAIAFAGALAMQGFSLPTLPEIKRAPSMTYLDRSGAVIGVRGGRDAPPVNLASLPAYVPKAFVSIEDRRFYEHSGFDPMGIARAVVTDIAKGRTAQGASGTGGVPRLRCSLRHPRAHRRRSIHPVPADHRCRPPSEQ